MTYVFDRNVDDIAFAVVVHEIDGHEPATAELHNWDTPHPSLCYVFVPESARRKGHGAAMVRGCIEHCRKHGKRSLALSVRIANTTAQALYERCGFKRVMQADGMFWMAVNIEPAEGKQP